MRIATFQDGFERSRLGVLTDSGLVDLTGACEKQYGSGLAQGFSDMKSFLSAGELGMKLAKEIVETALSEKDPNTHGIVKKLKAPISNPSKIFCPAVNYMSHSTEDKVSAPKEPYFFGKFSNAIVGPDEPILIPAISDKVDYEVELAALIGKRGKNIPEDQVYDHIAGYTILNDVSFRDLQGWPPRTPSILGQNWVRGKGLDSACPLGPFLITRDELPEPYPLKISLKVNGEVRQNSDTDMQIFKISELISHLSQGLTLEPGDIISTGTPSGVASSTGRFLKEGDIVEAEIEKIGVLRNPVLRA